jgi:hypothetical protein
MKFLSIQFVLIDYIKKNITIRKKRKKMAPQLEIVQITAPENNLKTFDDIMSSLYINEANSFLEVEENIKLPYWKRFSYFYSLNVAASCMLCFPETHSPLFALSMTLPAVGALILSMDKKSSANIFRIFSFTSSRFKTKVKLTQDIDTYRKEIAEPILSIKRNQLILLKYYESFYNDNKFCLSPETVEAIDNLKYYFEYNQYDNALDCIYNLYKKVRYVENFNNELN